MKIIHTKLVGWLLILFGMLAPVVFAQDIPIPEERFSDVPRPSAGARAKLKRLKLAVAENPESAEAWTDLGWRLYKESRYGECDWVMSEARKRSPNDPYVLWLSGLASYAMGHYADAKQYLWKMWTDNKTWPDTVDIGITYDVLGRIALHNSKDLFTASYFFSKAADEMPKNWQVHFMLGVSEWYRRRPGEALDALEKARSLNSKDPVILSHYALARVATDERHKYYTKKAVEQNLWPEAADDERKAIEAYNADIKVIKKAIAADPKNAENFELLGRYHYSLDRIEEAITALRHAVALDENNGSTRYVLAKFLHKTGTEAAKNEAKQLLIRSIALSPGYWEGGTDAPHVGMLIRILIQEGRIIQAQELADWLIEQDSEDQ